MPHYEAVSDGDRIRTPSPLPAADSIQEVEDLKKDPRVYTQLSQDDESQQISARVRDQCIPASFLVGLALLFASISITVGVLYHFSQSEGGLTTEQESRRYSWIYGPTACKACEQYLMKQADHIPSYRPVTCFLAHD
jgi:hypothetical protein